MKTCAEAFDFKTFGLAEKWNKNSEIFQVTTPGWSKISTRILERNTCIFKNQFRWAFLATLKLIWDIFLESSIKSHWYIHHITFIWRSKMWLVVTYAYEERIFAKVGSMRGDDKKSRKVLGYCPELVNFCQWTRPSVQITTQMTDMKKRFFQICSQHAPSTVSRQCISKVF